MAVELADLLPALATGLGGIAAGYALKKRPKAEVADQGYEGLVVEEDGTTHIHVWNRPHILDSETKKQRHRCKNPRCGARLTKPLGWVPRG